MSSSSLATFTAAAAADAKVPTALAPATAGTQKGAVIPAAVAAAAVTTVPVTAAVPATALAVTVLTVIVLAVAAAVLQATAPAEQPQEIGSMAFSVDSQCTCSGIKRSNGGSESRVTAGVSPKKLPRSGCFQCCCND